MNTSMASQVFVVTLLFTVSESLSQQPYYPLAVGNVWEFADAQHQTRAIGDTLMPDGHHYAILLDTWYNARFFQRQQGDSVFTPGSLLYDFSRSPGDTVVHNGNFVCILVSRGVVQIFGRQLRQWVFGLTWGPFTGEQNTVTDSIGVTAILSLEPPPGWTKVLTGAIIDGITYGVVSALQMPVSSLPGRFKLERNYPNPFNPSTTIRYELAERSDVTLTVFNLLGQEVRTLVDETQDAGYRSVGFDASTSASGVYFYRLKAGDFVQTRKMAVSR